MHWEVGNAFSALLKRRRLKLAEVQAAMTAYAQIPIRFVDVELAAALELADRFGLYAYDAYLMACARRQRALCSRSMRGWGGRLKRRGWS